jgi:hypothetical protein
MNRDLRLGVLAAVAAMVPGSLLLALGVPGSVATIVTIGCGVGVVVALGRRWHYQSTARTSSWYDISTIATDTRFDLVLDDAGRGGEAEIARQWQRDFPDLHFRMVGVGRGLFVASVQASTLDLLP